jgi:sulfur-carrier protein adenylyltransferase/sulfurtransferase
MLSPAELSRYSRHLLLPEVGKEGQVRLKRASVLVVGAGGLGSPLLMYLAAAGVGRIGIVDFDTVELSNLQRQVLFGDADLGAKKTDAAARRLRGLNPHIEIDAFSERLTSQNALDIVGSYDLVADGTDNFATRYLINDACVLLGKLNVYASIYRFDGQLSVFGDDGGPCYRCLYPQPPPPGMVPSCAEGGVLGVLPGIMGSLQAAEVIKLICGIGSPLTGRLLLFDATEMSFKTLRVERDPSCPVCGDQPTQNHLIDYDDFCGTKAIEPDENLQDARNQSGSNMKWPGSVPEISVFELRDSLKDDPGTVIVDVRTPIEYQLTNIGGLLIPLSELAQRIDELSQYCDREVVVICKSGERSEQAVKFLRQSGIEGAVNLRGGILAWSKQIDSSIPTY